MKLVTLILSLFILAGITVVPAHARSKTPTHTKNDVNNISPNHCTSVGDGSMYSCNNVVLNVISVKNLRYTNQYYDDTYMGWIKVKDTSSLKVSTIYFSYKAGNYIDVTKFKGETIAYQSLNYTVDGLNHIVLFSDNHVLNPLAGGRRVNF